MNIFKKNRNNKNKLRLQKIVDKIQISENPIGWRKEIFAVGGLSEVGFSKNHPELLLVISSQGRGVIDCSKLKLIDRDNNIDYNWLNAYELWSNGIGKLSNEKISVGGLHGGGLPHSNQYGDKIQYLATEWPIIDLILEPNFKRIYNEGDEKYCFRVFHDYELITYGFSYNGEYFVTATSSEITVFKKDKID